jgi:alkanesulfonate monooxygenase SsuD/methylene tetrahydromethanopterin reductase-like flavin-dependent oxidoreductase (luciferase family)
MHFGIFMEFGLREGGTEADAFREGLALVDAAEAWGLDSAWLAEFHFSPERSVLSSPIVVAAAMAARTKRIRIGLAVYVLPLNNPLRIAEEAATVDQLSGGRLDFGIGRSGFVRTYNVFNIDYAESQGRFEESLDVLRLAWRGEKFSHDGTYYKITDALLVPRPIQRPAPPMRMAASSAGTFKTVAEQGLPLFVGLRGDGLGALAENIEMYRETWRARGHDGAGSVFLRVPVYAADTEAAAHEEPRANIVFYFERQAAIVMAGAPKGGNAVRADMAAKLSALSYDDILRDRVAFGTAAQLIERISEWRDVLGIDGITAELNAGNGLSEAQVKNSLRILTRDVMPAFK